MNKQPEVTAATRKRIIDAFWSLYKEKTIDKITVAEITKITGNNRVTFYHYFKDVYAVLEQVEDDLIKEIQQEVDDFLCDPAFASAQADVNTLYAISVPIFKKHSEKIFTLLGRNNDSKFMNQFRDSIRTSIIRFWNMKDDIKYLDYVMEYSYSAMIGLMAKWYENGHDLTDGEFLKMAQSLVANGILGYINKEDGMTD